MDWIFIDAAFDCNKFDMQVMLMMMEFTTGKINLLNLKPFNGYWIFKFEIQF